MAVRPNKYKCVSGDMLKTISFIRAGLALETLSRKVPDTGMDDRVAVMLLTCVSGTQDRHAKCTRQCLVLGESVNDSTLKRVNIEFNFPANDYKS